ncbi:MAG: tetratricopeptide repeat protein [Exilispira sp.]
MIYALVLFILISTGLAAYFLIIKKIPLEIQIQKLYDLENYIGVIDFYKRNEDKLKNSIKALFFYGNSLYKIEDISNAILVLTPIEKSENFNQFKYKLEYYEVLGDCFFNTGSFVNAFYYYYRVLLINPQDFKALLHIGKIYAANGQFKKAKIFLNDAKSINPKNKELITTLALIEFADKKFNESLSLFNIARELDPRNINLLFYLGYLKAELKNFSDALDMLKEVIKYEKNPRIKAFSYYLMGYIYQYQHNVKIAIQYYTQVLENRKYISKEILEDVLYSLMLAYFIQKEYKKAFQILDILFSIDRNYKDISDIAFEKERIISKPNFIKTLEDWNSLITLKFPQSIIEENFLFAKNIDLSQVEKKLGITLNVSEKLTFDQFINAKYQDWVFINMEILKFLNFTEVNNYTIENDPDLFMGTGIYFTAKKNINGKLTSFLIKFSRNKTITKETIIFSKELKDSINAENLLFIHAYSIPYEILALSNTYKDIEFINRSKYQHLFETFQSKEE